MKITEKFGRLLSFRDLTELTEAQSKVANSNFGPALFSSGDSQKSSSFSKKTKTLTFSTGTFTILKPSMAEILRFHAKCLHCSRPHFICNCRQYRVLSYSEKWELWLCG